MKGGWYLGVAETMGHVHKMSQFDNWNLLKTVSQEILAMQQSRNYNEVPIQCLHFCHNILNAFQILLFHFSKRLAIQCTPKSAPSICGVRFYRNSCL